MDDLMILIYLSPPLIAFALLQLVSHLTKKRSIKRKQQEREHRQAMRHIARDKELDRQLQFEFSLTDEPKIIRANENIARIIEYVQKNIEK